MVEPQGKLYLCDTPLHNSYEHQLNFNSVEEQTTYFMGTVKHDFSSDNFTYLKENETITVGAPIDEIRDSNYLFYRNVGFTNKWYYAFINKMEYVNEDTTRLYIETDVIQTWYFDIVYNKTFIERETVSNDTIGLHTFPENLETGEYTNHDDKTKFGIGSCHAVVCTSEDPFRPDSSYPYNVINSIPSGLHYFVVGDFTSVNFIGWLTQWAAKKSDLSLIQAIYIVPDSMTGYTDDNDYWSYALNEGVFNYAPYHKLSEFISGSFNLGDTTITKAYNNIDGYRPKNNKLFVHPYNFMILDNHGGSCEEYRYEDFTSTNCVFTTKGDITPGCSIRTIPRNYKNIEYNYSEGMNALKLPIGSWEGDVYTNWLTQNSVNLGVSLASSTASILGGVYTGSLTSGLSGIGGIASAIGTIYQHSRIPNQVYGNQNSGDVTYSDGESCFTLYKRTIKSEYAKIIDDYFSMYGYKVNSLKMPEIKARRYWNYIKTINCNFTGNIPEDSMNKIRECFNNGITFWNGAENIFNYSLNNAII